MSNLHSSYIRRCLQLAKKGLGTTSPNPMVGAVIVKNGEIIGEGFHYKKGEPHAEVNAISSAKEDVSGATVYCSLEPCCHTNKVTPPCTDLLIEKRVSEVIVATLDPNPEVAGKGLKKLEEHGIKTSFGYCVEEALELNKVFFKSVQSPLPYIHLKVAATLDGRVATQNGDSKWISGEESRAIVHKYRKQYDSVMIGRNTLNADNPRLTARSGEKVVKTPKAIIIGNPSLMNQDSYLFQNKDNLFLLSTDSSFKAENVFNIDHENGLAEALVWLKKKGVHSILIEGGSKLATSIIEQELYDELSLFLCPKVIGNGPAFFGSDNRSLMKEAINLTGSFDRVGGDLLFQARKNVYRAS